MSHKRTWGQLNSGEQEPVVRILQILASITAKQGGFEQAYRRMMRRGGGGGGGGGCRRWKRRWRRWGGALGGHRRRRGLIGGVWALGPATGSTGFLPGCCYVVASSICLQWKQGCRVGRWVRLLVVVFFLAWPADQVSSAQLLVAVAGSSAASVRLQWRVAFTSPSLYLSCLRYVHVHRWGIQLSCVRITRSVHVENAIFHV
jgi:hypothetical protein